MAMLTVRNIPEEVHRALGVRAAQHGHSMEAEVRGILESAVSPEGRVKLGSLLADVGCTQAYAKLMAKFRALELSVASADGYIAAIAAANGLAVATRDTGAFEAGGAAVINPWLG